MIESRHLSLRPGRPDDDLHCGRIIAAATMASVLPDRLPHAVKRWANADPLPAGDRSRLVALVHDVPVGFADYDPERGHVRYLFIDPAAQGSGLGAQLLAHIQAQTQTPISVHCLAINDTALRWYLRQGFAVADGFLEDLFGEDAVWLRLVRSDVPSRRLSDQ